MRKYSLPVRIAALLCAVCLLLTGCGQVAVPDNSGEPSTFAPTAEPAAEETELTIEDLELTDTERKAAQLAAKHLGENAVLTDVVEFSSDDFGPVTYHVLLLKDTRKNYLAYRYGTGSVYCFPEETVQNFNKNFMDSEEVVCTYLLRSLFSHTNNLYISDRETVTKLTQSEVEEVNQALRRGEVLADVAEEAQAAREELEVAQRAAADEQTAQLAARLTAEYLKKGISLTNVVELSADNFEGAPCHVLLLKSADDEFLAYGYDTEKVYCPSSDEVWNYQCDAWTTDWGAEENRCLYLLLVLANHADGSNDIYVSSEETRTELTAAEVKQVNLVLRQGSIAEEAKAAQDERKTARQAAISAQAAQLAAEHFGEDAVLTNVEDVSLDNFGGEPCHVLLLKDENDRFLAYNYDSEVVCCPASSEIRSYVHINDNDIFRTEKTQYIYLLRQFSNHTGDYVRRGETLTELTAEEVEQANWAMAGEEEAYALLDMEPEQVKERVKTAADVLMLMLAGQYGDCHGSITAMINGQPWQHNLTAFQVMETRTTNCGSAANLANYLLEGDYEEIGFILHAYYIGGGGGHVYNYFKYQGKYYIVDFSWYMFANYQPGNDFPVMELDRLEDYGSRISELYGGVCMAFAHTSPGQHYPNVFDVENAIYAIPEGVEYTLLYQETGSDCYILKEYPLDKSQLDWTIFGEP